MNFLALAKLSELIQNINFENIWMLLNYFQVFFLGIVGIAVSALSFSGTWLILISALIFKAMDTRDTLGFSIIGIYAVICILVELVEPFAVKLGIQKYGGSKKGEIIGILSGVLGSILGEIIIPIPFLGNLIGMFLLSFFAVYCIEYRRLNCRYSSAKIAWGGVLAKVFMLLFKFLITFAMFLHLIYVIL